MATVARAGYYIGMGKSPLFIAAQACALLALVSCASAPKPAQAQFRPQSRPAAAPAAAAVATAVAGYRSGPQITAPLSEDEAAVLVSASELLGYPPNAKVVINGRTFILDCIGTVSAIYFKLGIDVQKDFGKYEGNGVARLYLSLAARGALHQDKLPRPGDVIVWDNTWDANGDGDLGDDPYTHAGIVVSVAEDGTVRYVHEHVRRGVIVEAMNLFQPGAYYGGDGSIINNALALGSGISRADNPPHWTSGDLFEAFGDVLREKAHFRAADKGS
jgi:hypothetical protein